MNKLSFAPKSLRLRMLAIFLLMLTIVVAVTLYTVQSATYKHSTQQLSGHAATSASVVRDKIQNRANLLVSALTNLSKDFSMKQLIAGGANDPASLQSALLNHQRRIDADISWVLNAEEQVLTTSDADVISDLSVDASKFTGNSIRWFKGGDRYYLVKAVPVKFVESSRNINAWVFMGILASRLINDELVELTDMQISLFLPHQNPVILGSTFTDDKHQALSERDITLDTGLHSVRLGDENHIYTTTQLGIWQDSPMYLLLATIEDKAYLSYNSLLGQLFGILGIAAVMALGAAMFMSKGITSPVTALVKVARKIRQGEYVEDFPTSGTNEVRVLSDAISDMQQGIRQREEEIHHLAYFDELTGLPNRTQFNSYINQCIEQQKEQPCAVLIMDLDRFKDINDTLGHQLGDRLLQEIAQRLKQQAFQNAFIARIGGDEYGIVLQNMMDTTPKLIGEQISNVFERPFILDKLTLDIDASIGIALYPEDADNTQGLIQCADIAMYSCKGHHESYAIYRPELNKHSVQRLSLMSELRSALAEGQLQLYYQPKLAIAENKITTVECLIRWIHPVHGFINPDDFIPLAEQTGAIRDVTHWALRTALLQQQQWLNNGHEIGVAVNISAMDLVDMKLPVYVSELMSEFNTPANMLTLEVTESAVMNDPENAIKALNTLQRMGITLSIDDFGTGYSSMAQLKEMPVNELKIDKAFVLELANNPGDQIMVKTMVSLAQNLSLNTVAEGVEDEQALAFLESIGCTKAQGYYLSRPLPADKFDEWHQDFLQQQQKRAG